MKTVLKTFLPCAVLCAALCTRGDETVSSALLWMVDDNYVKEVSGTIPSMPVSQLVSRPDGLPVNYARMLAVKTDGSETTPIFLNLFTSDGEGGLSEVGTFTDVALGYAGPLWADVTGYEDPAWSFMIELGNFDDSGTEDVWTVMAYSEKATYDQLRRFIQPGEIPDPTMTPWQGGAYAVPEPTSGLLVMLGGALLALRRRRKVVCVVG